MFFGMFIASRSCFGRRVDANIKVLELPIESLPEDYF